MKHTILTAASLLSDGGDNPEYDRALVELVCTLAGVDTSDGMVRITVLEMLKALA